MLSLDWRHAKTGFPTRSHWLNRDGDVVAGYVDQGPIEKSSRLSTFLSPPRNTRQTESRSHLSTMDLSACTPWPPILELGPIGPTSRDEYSGPGKAPVGGFAHQHAEGAEVSARADNHEDDVNDQTVTLTAL
jgi:hypothetical protein